MKLSNINRFLIINLVIIMLLGIFQVQAQISKRVKTSPKTQAVSKTEKETIENIVREYLLKNPSVIREALQALQVQEEREKVERAAAHLKSLQTEIYSDADSPAVGNPSGDVTIVAFFDYNCGYCKKTLPELQTVLAKDKSVRVIYKELPILGEHSQLAARIALAAQKQGKYEAFHHALMTAETTDEETIKSVSDKLGLDYAKLQKDSNDPKINEALVRNYRLAAALEINGTPAYIVGGQIIPGAIDVDSLVTIVGIERAKLVEAKSVKAKPETK